MVHSLLILDEGNCFREYRSIRSLCLELSRMAGVNLRGESYRLEFLVPFREVGPDLFDVAELDTWFKDNVRGPDFPRNPSVNGRHRPPEGWWAIDKEVQKAWRVKAEAELRQIIGHISD